MLRERTERERRREERELFRRMYTQFQLTYFHFPMNTQHNHTDSDTSVHLQHNKRCEAEENSESEFVDLSLSTT